MRKVPWARFRHEELNLEHDMSIDEVRVTSYPHPSSIPMRTKVYRTIHDSIVIDADYDFSDQEPRVESSDKYGSYILGLHTGRIFEAIFHSKKHLKEWMKVVDHPCSSKDVMVRYLTQKNIVDSI